MGESFWYLDSMGSKARNGYSVYCRQNFIGIDYGLLECESGRPVPDYYAALIW